MLLLALQAPSPPSAPDPPPDSAPAVFHGRRGQSDARIPRIDDAKVTIDGRLDEAVWSRAAILTGFSQFTPIDNRPAEDSTEVLVFYSSHAIYFGIRAFEPHGVVNATLADRDKIDGDDRVEILLDTFNDHRMALSFGVNPLGIQADGFRTNSPIPRPDFTTDFVYQSKGRLTDYGYEVEVRIPFKSIRFQSTRIQTWGLNFDRLVQHSGHENTWTPALLSSGPLVAQSGHLVGLTDLKRGLVLDVDPFTLERLNGLPSATPGTGWNYASQPQVGFNARWGVTPNLALDVAANPDFSQVEADAGQIPQDVRFAIKYPEKRPFFLDGIEKFNVMNSLIYTRRIAAPVGALRMTGKVAGLDIGFISAVDGKGSSVQLDSALGSGLSTAASAASSNPIYNWLRLRRDVGTLSTAGVTYTDKVEGSAWNRVAEGDVHLVWNKQYFVDIQNAWSFTNNGSGTTIAPLWESAFDCTGHTFGCRYGIRAIHQDFSAQGGFIPRTGIVDESSITRFTLIEGKPGATIEKLNIRLNTDWIWGFDEYNPTRVPSETKAVFAIPMNLRGGWVITPGMNWETYRFNPSDYVGYALQRTIGGATDTSVFVLPGRINDVWTANLQINSPQFPRFAFSALARAGTGANFLEPSLVSYLSFSGSADWRPTDKFRLNAQYSLAQRGRPDGTRFSLEEIPRLKIEYQLARPLFIRAVGQYTVEQQDALRDPTTGFPILVKNTGGTYVKSAIQSSNNFRIDWLLSYRPTPGTVVFLGYGSTLAEPDPLAFRALQRASDGFFVKLSYLLRA